MSKDKLILSSTSLDLKDYVVDTHFVIVLHYPKNFDKVHDIYLYQLYKMDKIGKLGAAKKDFPEIRQINTMILEKRFKDEKEFKEETETLAKYFGAMVSNSGLDFFKYER